VRGDDVLGRDRTWHRAARWHGVRRRRSRLQGDVGRRREAPVGFTDIRLRFELDTDATDEQIADLLATTERYCVVLQTLRTSPVVEASVVRG
jgi:uncharacterized OsmC-like protein